MRATKLITRGKVDENQANLFGWPPSPPSRSSRPRKPPTEAAIDEPESIGCFAARASPADLDELVGALPDAALAHLALTSARQLRRRVGRGRGSGKGRGRHGPLERAVEDLAREWAMPADEEW